MARVKLGQVLGILDDNRERLAGQITKIHSDTRYWLAGRLDVLQESINQLHPIHIDMDEALANAVIEKVHGPLTISEAAGEWLARVAGKHDFQMSFPIGYSEEGGVGRLVIHANGSMYLELDNRENEIIWQGTFLPPSLQTRIGESKG